MRRGARPGGAFERQLADLVADVASNPERTTADGVSSMMKSMLASVRARGCCVLAPDDAPLQVVGLRLTTDTVVSTA